MNVSKNNKRKLFVALFVNLLIVVMEAIGIYISYTNNGLGLFKYYTQDSNIFAMISSTIFSIYTIHSLSKSECEIPRWVKIIKYMSTCCLTVTFVVVVCVLIPIAGFDSFKSMMFENASLYHHFLCPVVSFISFVFIEEKFTYEKNYMFISIIPTILYAIVSVCLNTMKVLYGPYPFLHVYEQPIWMSVIWVFVIIGGAYLFAWFIKTLSCARSK